VVEAVTGFRAIGTVYPIAVQLTRTHIGKVAVPHLMREFRKRHALQLSFAGVVEEAELDPFGVGRE
jgi:hypothetical protein